MAADQDFGREQRLLDLAVKLELGTADQDEILEAANALSHTGGDRLRLEHRVDALELGLAYFMRVMKIFSDPQHQELLWWRVDKDGIPLQFAVNCSYIFKADLDSEDITPESLADLEQAVADVTAAGYGIAHLQAAAYLYVARRRQEYPSLPTLPDGLLGLFDKAEFPDEEGPYYAHDAHCNTIHEAGPEPCPPPRVGLA